MCTIYCCVCHSTGVDLMGEHLLFIGVFTSNKVVSCPDSITPHSSYYASLSRLVCSLEQVTILLTPL